MSDQFGTGHNAGSTFGEKLEVIVATIECLEADKKEIAGRIKDTYKAASKRGFDAETIRGCIKDRKIAPAVRAERDALRDIYRAALGMLDGTPLGDAARKRLAEQANDDHDDMPPGSSAPNREDDDRDDGDNSPPPTRGERSTPRPTADVPPSPEEIDEAKRLGADAAANGIAVTDNPFPAGDPCRAAWDEAWCRTTGSDGMDIPESWRRRTQKKKPADDAASTPPEGGRTAPPGDDAGDGA